MRELEQGREELEQGRVRELELEQGREELEQGRVSQIFSLSCYGDLNFYPRAFLCGSQGKLPSVFIMSHWLK